MSLVEGVAGENQEGEDDMNINRITADRVLAAFETTGLIPMQEEWLDTTAGRNCACGLMAVYAARFGLGSLDDYVEAIKEGFELEHDYVNGFTVGFDGRPDKLLVRASGAFKQGYEDGKAAWEAVKHLSEPLSNVDEDNEDNEN